MNSLQFEGILLCLEDSLVILTQMSDKLYMPYFHCFRALLGTLA